MAIDAVSMTCRRPMRFAMAAGTDAIVIGSLMLGRIMRVMASQTGERPIALPEAGALTQVRRLVPDVPGEVPVDLAVGCFGGPMAAAAEYIALDGGHSAGIVDALAVARARMQTSWPMAGLAMDSRFGRLNCFPPGVDGTSRVTRETSDDTGQGVAGFVDKAGGFYQCVGLTLFVSGCRPHAVERAVVRECMLQIPVALDAADEGHRLVACAEGPLHGNFKIIAGVENGDREFAGVQRESETISGIAPQFGTARKLL